MNAESFKMSADLIKSLIISLALTLSLECGFFYLTGKRNKSDLLLVVMVNILTNPAVVLLYWLAASYTFWNIKAVNVFLELFAVLAEGCCYLRYGREIRRPFVFSLAANAFSFGMAFLFQRLITYILGGIYL